MFAHSVLLELNGTKCLEKTGIYSKIFWEQYDYKYKLKAGAFNVSSCPEGFSPKNSVKIVEGTTQNSSHFPYACNFHMTDKEHNLFPYYSASALVDNTHRDLLNSSYPTKAEFNNC